MERDEVAHTGLRMEAELIKGPPVGYFRTQVQGRVRYFFGDEEISEDRYWELEAIRSAPST